jgi:hypothetical protein
MELVKKWIEEGRWHNEQQNPKHKRHYVFGELRHMKLIDYLDSYAAFTFAEDGVT